MPRKRVAHWIGNAAWIPDGVTRAVEKLKAMRAKSVALVTKVPTRADDARAA